MVPLKDEPTIGKLVVDAQRDISKPDLGRDPAREVRAPGQRQGGRRRHRLFAARRSSP
jgi:hypothetical protein